MPETITPFPKKVTLDPKDILEPIFDTEAFQDNVKRYNLPRAIARSALEQTGMDHHLAEEDTYEPNLSDTNLETALNAMVGAMPAFVHGIEGIRAYHTEGNVSSREYRSMKGRAAHFNHTVKSIIKQNTSLNFENLADTVTTLYGLTNRDRWGDDRSGYEKEAKWFSGQFDGLLRGMQQEVLAQQVIQAINLVDPITDPKTGKERPRVIIDTNVSVEDDLKGADMYITLDNVTFPIDIKASERTAMNTRRKSSHPNSIITTGFTSQELDGAFRINTKLAKKAAPDMLQKLYAAREEFVRKNHLSEANPHSPHELAIAA
jgi:hypothetical protein